jgi:predicted metal-dependent HD superfamily phosphohydrolase
MLAPDLEQKKPANAGSPFVSGRLVSLSSAPAAAYTLAMNREELAAAYAAPGRHYHNLAHIEDCLALLAQVDGLSASEREVLSEAIWWHDVVYDPTRSDNEELSAQLAERHVRADLSSEVGRLIRLTRTHDVKAEDRLGAILISIDLSILGADPARYDAYAAAIRQEFIHVSDADFRAGRAAVLRRFAARPAIYPDAGFAAKYDHRARENLARELASLS